jgi:hypothetical protein
VLFNVAHVAGLAGLGAFHEANYITLLGPISGMEAQGEYDVPYDSV